MYYLSEIGNTFHKDISNAKKKHKFRLKYETF